MHHVLLPEEKIRQHKLPRTSYTVFDQPLRQQGHALFGLPASSVFLLSLGFTSNLPAHSSKDISWDMHHKRTPSSKTALTSAKAKSMRHIPLTTPCDTYVELKVTNRFKRLTTAYKYNAYIDQHWNQTHGKKKHVPWKEKKKEWATLCFECSHLLQHSYTIYFPMCSIVKKKWKKSCNNRKT